MVQNTKSESELRAQRRNLRAASRILVGIAFLVIGIELGSFYPVFGLLVGAPFIAWGIIGNFQEVRKERREKTTPRESSPEGRLGIMALPSAPGMEKYKRTTHRWFVKSISIMLLGIAIVAAGIYFGGLSVITGSVIGLSVHIYGIVQLRKANFERHVDQKLEQKLKEEGA